MSASRESPKKDGGTAVADLCRVLNERRKPIGYLDMNAIKAKLKKGDVNLDDIIGASAYRFRA